MSARGDLVAMASGAWISDYATSREDVDAFLREAEVAVDAYRDEVAHELAERLIGEAATRTPIEVYRPGLMWAAEVIDPQPDEGD